MTILHTSVSLGFVNNIIILLCELSSQQIHLYIRFLIKAGNDCTLAFQNKSPALHLVFQQDPHTVIVHNLKLTAALFLKLNPQGSSIKMFKTFGLIDSYFVETI